MHTDGRNIDLSRIPEDINVVMGKPINGKVYRGGCGPFDGLFMVGLHAMSREPGAMLAHSYLREYDSIRINSELVGEIGVERALAGEQGFPLVFVSGDDKGCEEAKALEPAIITAVVKKSLDDAQAVCMPPVKTSKILKVAAKEAAAKARSIVANEVKLPVTIQIKYTDCTYLQIMKRLYPNVFVDEHTVEMKGNNLLECWSEYLTMEKEMVSYRGRGE